jgi:hypothetical protein
MARVLSSKPIATADKHMTGKQHYMSDGTMIDERSNDVTGLINANKFLRGEQSLHHKSETFNHVASIDVIALENWCKARGMGQGWYREFMNSETLLKEFLNDPDNVVWRTRKGKI